MVELWYPREGQQRVVRITVDSYDGYIIEHPRPFGTVRVVEGTDLLADVVPDQFVRVQLLKDSGTRSRRSRQARVIDTDVKYQDLSQSTCEGRGKATQIDWERNSDLRGLANGPQ